MSGPMNEGDPERALALTYAAEPGRAGLAALLALDDALGKLIRTTREPALGQIRLAWWRERLTALDSIAPPAEPVLAGLAEHVVAAGVSGESLAPVTEGWELLLVDELDVPALRRFGELRGGLLFAAAGKLLGAEGDPVAVAGQGWALADLAGHMSDPAAAGAARGLADTLLDDAMAARWSREGRALGALAHLARMGGRTGSPVRVGRLLWHRLTGR